MRQAGNTMCFVFCSYFRLHVYWPVKLDINEIKWDDSASYRDWYVLSIMSQLLPLSNTCTASWLNCWGIALFSFLLFYLSLSRCFDVDQLVGGVCGCYTAAMGCVTSQRFMWPCHFFISIGLWFSSRDQSAVCRVVLQKKITLVTFVQPTYPCHPSSVSRQRLILLPAP